MEPRHEPEELAAERAAEGTEESRDGRGQEDVRIEQEPNERRGDLDEEDQSGL